MITIQKLFIKPEKILPSSTMTVPRKNILIGLIIHNKQTSKRWPCHPEGELVEFSEKQFS
jgi:hypothetical protein